MMFCPKCGSELENDFAFCSKCGASIGKTNNQYGSTSTINSVVVKTNKLPRNFIIILSIILIIGIPVFYKYYNSPKQKIVGTWYTTFEEDMGTFTFDNNGVLTIKSGFDERTLFYTIGGNSENQATLTLHFMDEEPSVGQIIFINRNYARITLSELDETLEIHK